MQLQSKLTPAFDLVSVVGEFKIRASVPGYIGNHKQEFHRWLGRNIVVTYFGHRWLSRKILILVSLWRLDFLNRYVTTLDPLIDRLVDPELACCIVCGIGCADGNVTVP